MIRLVTTILGFCCLLVFSAASVQAQTPLSVELFDRNATPPDINSVPILTEIVKNGAKLYYLGERSGLHGWFIMKDGQIQMIYVTADKKSAMIGGLFTSLGENVTGPQIEALAGANAEVAAIMNGPAKQQDDVAKAGSTPGGFAAVPGGTSASPQTIGDQKLPLVSLSPGDRLLQDLQAAAGVVLGKNDNAEIIMVIAPTCPHCKATWKEMRDSVQANRVQIKLVPITNDPATDDARAAAQLLRAANPFEVWDKYVNGDKSALAGEADSVHLKAVLVNNQLIDKWNIRSTPYLVYRAKDGRVKIVQGKPERMAAVLSDLIK